MFYVLAIKQRAYPGARWQVLPARFSSAAPAASSVDLTAGAYTVAVVKLAAGCALSALFASLSGALFDAAED